MDFEHWESIVDFSGNCRLCLAECNDLTEIFCGSSDPNDSWVQKITSLIPIELRLTDGLPQGVCKGCVLQLSQTHSFISNSLLVDAWLRNRLNSQTDEVKDEIVESEVEIAPHGELDPLAFEQYEHLEQPEQECSDQGSDYDPDEDSDQFDGYEDDELKDKTYTEKPLKRKRSEPVGSKKNKIKPADSDLPKRKRGRPPGPKKPPTKKPPKEKPTGKENYDCTVCQIKFFTQQTLTKHLREKACIAAPKAGPASEKSQKELSKVKTESDERLNGFPDKADADDDWWQKEAKESSEDDDVSGLDADGPVIFTCAECEKTFATHAKLKRHMRCHNELGRFRCDLCPMLFCNQKQLLDHYRTHTGDKPYACDKCPRTFSVKKGLKIHERTHTGERPFACPMCPKTFAQFCILRLHKRIHTGERPYACALCPKKFSSHTTLKKHVRWHNGDKPFTCNFCPKSFIETSKRKIHERRVHTKEKTIKCKACDEMFIDIEKRAKHMKKEHKDVD